MVKIVVPVWGSLDVRALIAGAKIIKTNKISQKGFKHDVERILKQS